MPAFSRKPFRLWNHKLYVIIYSIGFVASHIGNFCFYIIFISCTACLYDLMGFSLLPLPMMCFATLCFPVISLVPSPVTFSCSFDIPCCRQGLTSTKESALLSFLSFGFNFSWTHEWATQTPSLPWDYGCVPFLTNQS